MASIILTPGFGTYKDIEWKLSPFSKWFEERGFDVFTYRQKSYGTNCIKQNAESLARFANKINDEVVILIGHSMGGIVASLAAEYAHIDRLITIASPLRGAPLAKLWPLCESIRQMQPNSDLLSHIDFSRIQQRTPMLTISCRYDLLVPAKNALVSGAEHYMANQTHLTVVFDRNVFNKVIKFI